DPLSRLVDVHTTRELTMKHTKHKNNAPLEGGFGGAGAEARVFITRNIGIGVESRWIDGQGSTGTVLGTLTARFPMGSNAPYGFGGVGVEFGDETKAMGTLGAGLEHRFS